MGERIKKPLYERNHKKISSQTIKEHIEHKTNEQTEYRSYYYDGQFESFFDKFVWYCYYQLDLTYAQIVNIIKTMRAKYKRIKQIFPSASDREITESLKRSKKLKAILFP